MPAGGTPIYLCKNHKTQKIHVNLKQKPCCTFGVISFYILLYGQEVLFNFYLANQYVLSFFILMSVQEVPTFQ